MRLHMCMTFKAQDAAGPESATVSRDDITIARSSQGKKMRIGEGGTGTVYKALMHSCDEVAVKVVRTAQPTLAEAQDFHKVPPASQDGRTKALRALD